MQCKDIDDAAFLAAVEYVTKVRNMTWASRYDIAAVFSGHPELIPPAGGWPIGISVMVDYDQLFPQKLIIAKARKLIRRGLLKGCYCGCRGDFELTGLTVVHGVVYHRAQLGEGNAVP